MAIVSKRIVRTPSRYGLVEVYLQHDDSVVAGRDSEGATYWVTGLEVRNATPFPVDIELSSPTQMKDATRVGSRTSTFDYSKLSDRTAKRRFTTGDVELRVHYNFPKARPGSVSTPTTEDTTVSSSVGNPTTFTPLNGLPTSGDTMLIVSCALGGLYPSGSPEIDDDFDVAVTWTKVNEDTSTNGHCSIWYGLYSGDPGTGKTVTVNHANTGRRAIHLASVSGHATSSTIAESVIGNTTSSTLDLALSDYGTGALLYTAIHARDSTSVGEDTNFTLQDEITASGNNEARLSVSYAASGSDLTVNYTGLNGTPSIDAAGVAFEIAQAVAAGFAHSQAVIVG